MTENLILPVPALLSAVYLVPVAPSATEIKKRTQMALPVWVPDPVGTAARKMLDVGAVRVADLQSSTIPPVPSALQEHLGVDPEMVQIVMSADRFATFTAAWAPGWPPVHESVARACAAALAADLGMPLVDTFIPKVLAPEPAIAALPDAASRLKLSAWVLVFQSAGHQGLWMTTKGMGRFGLPELQVHNVPPQYGGLWTSLLLGVAGRLLDLWLDALRAREGSAFVQIPGTFEVSEADVAGAYNADPRDGGHVPVRLTFDPAPDDRADSFLTIQPPDDYSGSAGEYLAYAVAEVFGTSDQEVRYMPSTEAMERAMKAARETLPAVRTRFLQGDLPVHARLMVKHALKTPDGTEYPWAYVNSWSNPATVMASSAGDAIHDRHVRTGRPIIISADTIVDWAIWIDGQGIVEGGLTNTIALSQGETDKP
jgi:hypothetical protein